MDPSHREIIDITRPLSGETRVWPGDIPFRRTEVTLDGWTFSRLRMSAHSGTHMDAPLHRVPGGASVDMLPLHRMILPATVCSEIPDAFRDRAVLLSRSVTGEEARALEAGGAGLVGTSMMSIDPGERDEAHRILLGAGIPVVENLLLDRVSPGDYTLICLPLRISGGDGSPVRAVLLKN